MVVDDGAAISLLLALGCAALHPVQGQWPPCSTVSAETVSQQHSNLIGNMCDPATHVL